MTIRHSVLVQCVLLLLIFLTKIALGDQLPVQRIPEYDEHLLQRQYDAFLRNLDYVRVAIDYPKVVKDLLSGHQERQVQALKMLGESGDLRVIPWLAPFLDSEDGQLRVWAGSAIEKAISSVALKRRDMSQPHTIVLRPYGRGDLDLRPLAWLALKMFRMPDDGNTHAYAASMTRYLELTEFEDELRQCLKSRHPAVSEKAQWALESLGLGTITLPK